jgi:serine/threonine protein kinase
MDRFIIGKKLGSGSFGNVFEITEIETGNKFAGKQITTRDPSAIDREIAIMRKVNTLRSEYFPIFYDLIIKSNREYWVIMELVDGQTMDKFDVRYITFTVMFFIKIIKAVKLLHSIGVAHADLKPENIMFNNETIKIMDFGLSCVFIDNSNPDLTCSNKLGIVGTPLYLSPEALFKKITSPREWEKSDVYALGITLYEIITKSLPFKAKTMQQLEIEKGQKITECVYDNKVLCSIILAMVEIDPFDRMSLDTTIGLLQGLFDQLLNE